MTYDLSVYSNVTDLTSLALASNYYTSGLFIGGFLFVLFIIITLYFVYSGRDFATSLMVSGWLMFVVSVLFYFSGLVRLYICLIFLSIAGIMIFVARSTNPNVST